MAEKSVSANAKWHKAKHASLESELSDRYAQIEPRYEIMDNELLIAGYTCWDSDGNISFSEIHVRRGVGVNGSIYEMKLLLNSK